MEVWEKSETVDPEVRAYVYSLVNAVGGRSTYDESYAIGDDALATLKDIIRWLRLYDEKTNRYDVKRCLAEANLVKGDLLEILAQWPEDATESRLRSKISQVCVELLVPLTWPLEPKNEGYTVNNYRHLPYLQLAQVGYKRAILHFEGAQVLRSCVRVGLPHMAVQRRDRTKRDEDIIKIMLYLIRNVAEISQPQHLPSQGDENEISRSATITAFHDQNILNLLLTIGSGASDEFQEQDVILLEILFHLLRGIDAKKLWMQKEQVATHDMKEFKDLLLKEKTMVTSYNKIAPTRHNRFGTMIWVKRDDQKLSTVSGQHSITSESSTLQQMDTSKKWDKPKYRGKAAPDSAESAEFGTRIDLTESARGQLRDFVEDFLDSSFNPLFSSLRKAIEREADRVADANLKQYFYLINWFLSAETARREATRSSNTGTLDRPEDNTFSYIAAVLDQETFVLLNRRMQRASDEKDWQTLQTTLLAFTQILLTVQEMSGSKDEEDQEIAENIQNRIFYEEATHDMIIQLLRGYKHQGFSYLEAVTDCAHVFLRMLERYSKQNVDLQIRSKRRARRKAKKQADNPDNTSAQDDAEDGAEDDAREAVRTVSERKFDFARFSAKFMTQQSVDTFISLLHFYRDLNPAQLKRCHRYFYRLAFKNELAVLLYRVDILLLFHRMIKGPQALSSEVEMFKDWEMLVRQIFRTCIKWLQRETEGEGWREMCMVEMLFSKVPNTVFYLQNGYEKIVEKKAPRPPADLDFKASVEEEKRLATAVSVMLEQNKGDQVAWVREELKKAMEERQGWEEAEIARRELARQAVQEAQHELADGAESLPAPSIILQPGTDERKLALFKDKHLRLLLSTLEFERLGLAEDIDATWIVPSRLSSSQLKATLEHYQQAEFDPITSASELVRNKSAATSRTAASGPFDDADMSDEGASDVDNPLFPPNIRSKRVRGTEHESGPRKKRRLTRHKDTEEATESDLERKAAARRQKEREKNAKIKSALFVTASDDETDEEEDVEFFKLEEERRQKMRGVIRELVAKGEQVSTKNSKKSKNAAKGGSKKKEKTVLIDDDTQSEEASELDMESDDEQQQPSSVPKTRPRRTLFEEDSDVESASSPRSGADGLRAGGLGDDDEDTPSTSPPTLEHERSNSRPMPLSEVNANALKGARETSQKVTTAVDEQVGAVEDDDDDDDLPVAKPAARRRVTAGFLDDSDDE